MDIATYPDDYGNNLNQANQLDVGTLISGELELDSDIDYFSTILEEGKTYLLQLKREQSAGMLDIECVRISCGIMLADGETENSIELTGNSINWIYFLLKVMIVFFGKYSVQISESL